MISFFHSLSVDKGETLDDMRKGNSFMACVEDGITESQMYVVWC